MSWIIWFVIIYFALNALIGPFLIGRRIDYTAGAYAISLALYAFMIISLLVVFA